MSVGISIAVARQPADCCECGQHIHLNTQYERIHTKERETHKTCLICAYLRERFWHNYPNAKFPFGGLEAKLKESKPFADDILKEFNQHKERKKK